MQFNEYQKHTIMNVIKNFSMKSRDAVWGIGSSLASRKIIGNTWSSVSGYYEGVHSLHMTLGWKRPKTVRILTNSLIRVICRMLF